MAEKSTVFKNISPQEIGKELEEEKILFATQGSELAKRQKYLHWLLEFFRSKGGWQFSGEELKAFAREQGLKENQLNRFIQKLVETGGLVKEGAYYHPTEFLLSIFALFYILVRPAKLPKGAILKVLLPAQFCQFNNEAKFVLVTGTSLVAQNKAILSRLLEFLQAHGNRWNFNYQAFKDSLKSQDLDLPRAERFLAKLVELGYWQETSNGELRAAETFLGILFIIYDTPYPPKKQVLAAALNPFNWF